MNDNRLIVIATSNEGKVKEIEKAFDGLGVRLISLAALKKKRPQLQNLSEPEETGATFLENAILKANYYSEKTGLSALADDSGLVVPALNGEPGIYSARYAGEHGDDNANNAKLIGKLTALGGDKWECTYECSLALVLKRDFFGSSDANKAPDILISEGVVSGTIINDARGMGGFGYDPYFYTAVGKTMAELTLDEKDAISHRGEALHKLREKLASVLNNMTA